MKFLLNLAFLDAATPWQLGFQDPATPIIIGIIHFHNHLIFFLVVIGTFVCWLLYRALVLFKEDPSREASHFTHNTPLEVVWTITPALVLLLIAGPSFALLYSIDEVISPHISLKVIGHQWYWSYEYSDYLEPVNGESIKFDSYIISEDDLTLGGLRLLEVDNRVKLPVNVHIRVLVTSADVLHSWAVPSLGIKIDACPGRLNQVSLFLIRKGVFYGQCSEICGVNHAFMPIVVESLSEESYFNWVKATLPNNENLSTSAKVVEGTVVVEDPVVVDTTVQSSENLSTPKVEYKPEDFDWLRKTAAYSLANYEGIDLIAHIKEQMEDSCSDSTFKSDSDQCLIDAINTCKAMVATQEPHHKKLVIIRVINTITIAAEKHYPKSFNVATPESTSTFRAECKLKDFDWFKETNVYHATLANGVDFIPEIKKGLEDYCSKAAFKSNPDQCLIEGIADLKARVAALEVEIVNTKDTAVEKDYSKSST